MNTILGLVTFGSISATLTLVRSAILYNLCLNNFLRVCDLRGQSVVMFLKIYTHNPGQLVVGTSVSKFFIFLRDRTRVLGLTVGGEGRQTIKLAKHLLNAHVFVRGHNLTHNFHNV